MADAQVVIVMMESDLLMEVGVGMTLRRIAHDKRTHFI
jgi:hypothetical protein